MITIIVALNKTGSIGVDGVIPWNCPPDRRFFRQTTMGHTLILGRKTFVSIPEPLEGRKVVVLSSQAQPEKDGVIFCRSLTEALNVMVDDEIFIGGGEQVYRESIKIADRILITRIPNTTPGDRYFPRINLADWNCKLFHPRGRSAYLDTLDDDVLFLELTRRSGS